MTLLTEKIFMVWMCILIGNIYLSTDKNKNAVAWFVLGLLTIIIVK